MRSPRRVTAFFVLLLLLQSIGLGSGALSANSGTIDCAATTAHTGNGSHETSDMASDMAGMPMPSQSPSPDQHGPDAPCGLPWALGCASAAACIPLVVPTAVGHDAGSAPVHTRISVAYTTRPESLVRVPEPPPPRG